ELSGWSPVDFGEPCVLDGGGVILQGSPCERFPARLQGNGAAGCSAGDLSQRIYMSSSGCSVANGPPTRRYGEAAGRASLSPVPCRWCRSAAPCDLEATVRDHSVSTSLTVFSGCMPCRG